MKKYAETFLRVIFLVMLSCGSASVSADTWPPKNVRIIVPYTPGGATDGVARYLAKRMEEIIKKPVIVENIPGGGTMVAAQTVLRAPADGANIIITGSGTYVAMKHTNPNLPIDPLLALTPISFVNTMPHWILVKSDRPERSFQDLIALIKRNPGKINISINEIGGIAHLALANWAKKNGLDITIVPYRGSSPAMIDLLGGITTVHLDVVGSSMSFVKAGKARALMVLQQNRLEDFPNIPTSPQEKSEGLFVGGQHVLAVKNGTPASTVNRIYEVVHEITAEPQFAEYLRNFGFERSVATPAKAKQILELDSKRYGDIVHATNIRVN